MTVGLLILPVLAIGSPVGLTTAPADEASRTSGLPPPSPVGPVRVYVISIDGLGPDDVTEKRAPFLHGLKEKDFWFDSVAVPPTTSTPNHAAMLTGVRGNRNGFVANIEVTNDRYRQVFQADHLFTRLHHERPDVDTGLFTTGAFLNLFKERHLCARDDQRLCLPTDADGSHERESENQHGPDVAVASPDPLSALLAWALAKPMPASQFALVHEPKVDDAGHVTPSETVGVEEAREARWAAIKETDERLEQFMHGLQAEPEIWSETVLIITSDHNMDFAYLPENFIDPAPVLQDPRARCEGSNQDNAVLEDPYGQQLVDVLPCEGEENEEFENKENFDKRVDWIVGELQDDTKWPGIGLVVSDRTTPSRADLGVDFPGPRESELRNATRAGRVCGPQEPDLWPCDPRDILMFAEPGYTFFPFLGTHGHPITQANVLMVIGGHHALADLNSPRPQGKFETPTGTSFASPLERPSVLSIAPTAALLFRLDKDHFYEGKVLREAFDPGILDSPPQTSFTHSCSGLTCSFDAAGSSDDDGSISSYEWDFGDGTTGAGVTSSHTYPAAGTYPVTLTVADNEGATSSTSQEITVTSTSTPAQIHVHDLDGSATDLRDGSWVGTVRIHVTDQDEKPVAGAAVSGTWSSGSASGGCITNDSGWCEVTSSTFRKRDVKSVTYRVDGVSGPSPYNASANHDADGDSDGTTITVNKQS